MRDIFFPSLITKMYKKMEVPKEEKYTLKEHDMPYNPQKAKSLWEGNKKKINIWEKG